MSLFLGLAFELEVQGIKIHFLVFGQWCNIYSIFHKIIKILSNKQTKETNYNILFCFKFTKQLLIGQVHDYQRCKSPSPLILVNAL